MNAKLFLTTILLLAVLTACANTLTPEPIGTETAHLPVVVTTQSPTATEPPLVPSEQSPQETTEYEPTALIPTEVIPAEPISIAAQNLGTPWEITFLPDGRFLVTERSGTLALVGGYETVRIPITDVFEQGESGLLGMALHPDFEANQWIYLYLTYQEAGELVNRVERHRLENDILADTMVIIDGIPGSSNHNGGRIEFGPDGLLYVTTGDAQTSSQSQDINSLAGKILRLQDDGSIPENNPFGNAVYSYGHRTPQGLAWDEHGRLWSTEHGPSGLGSGYDELNLIEIGGNYGWPEIQGDQTREGMITPLLQSGSNETWAPGDLEIVDGAAYFVGLRGSTLYTVPLNNLTPESLERHFVQEFGRLRALRLGPDGLLYMGTSNTDGRGRLRENDDKVFRIDWRQLP